MSDERFWVRFKGIRGGYAMPGPTTIKYGGHTTCVEVHAGDHLLIIDAGSGLISLGKELVSCGMTCPENIIILMTHFHHDHVQGLPFFTPAYDPACKIFFFGPEPLETMDLESVINHVMLPPYFPLRLEELRSQRRFTHIRQGDRIVLTEPTLPPQFLSVHDDPHPMPDSAVIVSILRSYNHPRDGVLIFRIDYQGRSFVFASDTEGYVGGDQHLINFCHGADLIAHDAEYDTHEYTRPGAIKQGWGHSTWNMAVEVGQAAAVKRLALIHHSPMHDDAFLDDMERRAQAIFPAAFMAREGQIIEL